MKIIIVGDGKIGYSLARHLSKEQNDVVIIDKDFEALRKAEDILDVMCIKGNGLRASILLEAGISNADLIIAVTASDEVNMLCCLTGKKLGAKHAIARIRDPEYTHELSMLKKEMELDMVINPEQEAAREITRLVRFPSAMNIDTFVNGKVVLVASRIMETDAICGLSLSEVRIKLPYSILFCTIVRGDDIIIPDGKFILKPGDIAYVLGENNDISAFFKNLGKYNSKIKSVMIIGGGRIAFYLGKDFEKMGVKVKIIEMNEQKCLELNEHLSKCLIIHGDGTDEDLLISENIHEMQAVITVTDRDEENLIIALYAVSEKVPKVIAKVNRINYNSVIKGFGIDSIVSPKNITAYQILRYVRALKNSMGSLIETLYKIVDGRAEAIEFTATNTTSYLRVPFKDVKFKKDLLVAALVRNGKIIIPSGNDFIDEKDSVILITKNGNVTTLNDVFLDGGK